MEKFKEPQALGRQTLTHFMFKPTFKNLNHGSFGTYPKVVRDQIRAYEDLCEACPDEFIRYTFKKLLDRSRASMANYLNVPMSEIVFIKSASAAINIVLRNMSYGPADVILYFSTAFDACENTIFSVAESTSLKYRRIPLTYPTTHGEIVRRFLETVAVVRNEGLTPRIALFDTIVSQPGIRFPFEKLIAECRRHDILSLVDGAHGVGHIPLDLATLAPDFFVSMAQKWLYNARGCAVFHVPKRNQKLIRTAMPTSHVFIPSIDVRFSANEETSSPATNSSFEKMFENVAITDNMSYLTIPEALCFRENVLGGEERIFAYLNNIAYRGGSLVAEILDTFLLSDTITGEKGNNTWNCAFANVRLPITIDGPRSVKHDGKADWPVVSATQANALVPWFHATLVEEFSTSLTAFVHDSKLWVRLSGQVYLEMEDFDYIGNALKELCARLGCQ
ncbi:hypothetical protein NLG97_g1958 [Lecanicillium saksenae]|uniref:Uncharacterized protein n=1 Tax=Lecanicillium saksenae TaxID=468837 RepID=A0ACC1R419_9HYPO|nr:hypothetical protein NLG97_g1958 [Lecanicillium saksenae]